MHFFRTNNIEAHIFASFLDNLNVIYSVRGRLLKMKRDIYQSESQRWITDVARSPNKSENPRARKYAQTFLLSEKVKSFIYSREVGQSADDQFRSSVLFTVACRFSSDVRRDRTKASK